MTAPDPLECLNSRAASERTTCGEPDSAHCQDCEMCPGACTCPPPTLLDDTWLRAALDAFAVWAGAKNWRTLDGVTEQHSADNTRAVIAAAIAPLQAEIRRLTASPAPACYPSARELVDAWNRRTEDEQLALAARFLDHQERALRCAMGSCRFGRALHGASDQIKPLPRTWRTGDAEPGDDVKFVRCETYGFVWTRVTTNLWHAKAFGINETWVGLLKTYGSVTEVEDE